MDVSAATWNTLSKLLDEALDLDPAARATWLEQIAAAQPDVLPSLNKLLAAHARSETADLLQRLPEFKPSAPGALPDDTALKAGAAVGPYRLLRELGSGGMADVWLAERADGAFERKVALKLPRVTRLQRDLAARFARERDILARLEHPNIARLYDAGIAADGLPYLAMEYIDGQPITTYCDDRRLDVKARMRLFVQVLDAVQYAHANLVIHRDLKPSNVLVTSQGQVRLLDFGIAKLLGGDDIAQETQLTQLAGRALTPDYASPEQIKGEPLTIATDVYSLGVVLYELLTGGRPYKLKLQSAAQIEQAVVAIEPNKPSSAPTEASAVARSTSARRLARVLTGDLDTIALKSLAKEPLRRYKSIADWIGDIERYLSGRVVLARPTPLRERMSKFIVRNHFAVGSAAAIAVVLMVATAVSLRQAQRAQEQARLAREQATRAEEVKKFVLSILEAADVSGDGSRQTTGVDLLKQAHARLLASPIADDAIRAELLTAIGAGLHGFGERDLATPMLAEATRLTRAKLGDDHTITAAARTMYAYVLMEQGRSPDALAHFDAAEAVARRTGNGVELAYVLRGKSVLRSNAGDPDAAIDLAHQAVQAADSQSPPIDRRAQVEANLILGGVLLSAQRKGALAPARRGYEIARELFAGKTTPLLLMSQRNYALALAAEGDADTALREIKEILQQQIELLGPDHRHAAPTYGGLGALYLRSGSVSDAVDSFRQALRIYSLDAAGKSTPQIDRTRMSLGLALAHDRRYAEALAELRTAERSYAARNEGDRAPARMVRSATGMVLTRRGRLQEANAIFDALLEQPFRSPQEAALTKGRLGMLRTAQRRYDEAQGLLREATAFFAETPSQWVYAQFLTELGMALAEGGRGSESVAVLQQAQTIFLESQRSGSRDLAEIDRAMARARSGLERVGPTTGKSTSR
jgi:serine/threonine-protein kinase